MKRRRNNIFIAVLSVVCILVCLAFSCTNNKYAYEDKLPQILDVPQVKVKSKVIYTSEAVGEWYVCEVYDLENSTFNSFLSGNKCNKLHPSDTSWVHKNWEQLPTNGKYNEVIDMVTNYDATSNIERTTTEMKKVIFSASGFYSFLCKPSIGCPQKILFFLLDDTTKRLYVVDLNF